MSAEQAIQKLRLTPLPPVALTPVAQKPVVFTPTEYVWRDPAMIEPRRFIYGKSHIRGFVTATVAPGGVGKSSLALVDALAMSTGRNLIGAHPVKPLRVWYINLEDPREEIERRVAAACAFYGVRPDNLFFDGREIEPGLVLAERKKTDALLVTPVVDGLTAALKAGKFDALTVDPFVSTHRVTENDNTAIDMVAKAFGRIAGEANVAVELVHHTRKTSGAEITAEDSRGASATVFAARLVRVLNPMTKQEADDTGVGARRGFYFRADNGKANLTPPSSKATWYELKSVPLNNGDAINPDGDHVGVVTAWQWPDAFTGVTVNHLREVQAVVAAGQWRKDLRADDWVGNAVAEVLDLDPSDKAHKAKIGALLKSWISSGMLVVVERKDEERKKRLFVEVGEPATD